MLAGWHNKRKKNIVATLPLRITWYLLNTYVWIKFLEFPSLWQVQLRSPFILQHQRTKHVFKWLTYKCNPPCFLAFPYEKGTALNTGPHLFMWMLLPLSLPCCLKFSLNMNCVVLTHPLLPDMTPGVEKWLMMQK